LIIHKITKEPTVFRKLRCQFLRRSKPTPSNFNDGKIREAVYFGVIFLNINPIGLIPESKMFQQIG
jgi:hypothetical protein